MKIGCCRLRSCRLVIHALLLFMAALHLTFGIIRTSYWYFEFDTYPHHYQLYVLDQGIGIWFLVLACLDTFTMVALCGLNRYLLAGAAVLQSTITIACIFHFYWVFDFMDSHYARHYGRYKNNFLERAFRRNPHGELEGAVVAYILASAIRLIVMFLLIKIVKFINKADIQEPNASTKSRSKVNAVNLIL